MNSSQRDAVKFDIEEGYAVRDLSGDEFGTVKSVHYYIDQTDVITPVPVAAPMLVAAGLDGHALPLVTTYGTFFDDLPDLPEEYRSHFYQHGFIRIGRGLFHSDMLASFDQISRVTDECVYLNVSKDDLLKV